MDDDAVRDFVLKLSGPQLAALIVRAGIEPRAVEGSSVWERAASVLTLAEGPGGPGLDAVRSALAMMFPKRDFAGQAVQQQRIILVLAASPLDRGGLSWRREVESIEAAMANTGFVVRAEAALRIEHLTALLAEVEPEVLHFTGHGTAGGEIVFENESGGAQPLQLSVLARILSERATHLRCIVLNACYTSSRAASLEPAAEYIIGMQQEIGDEDAAAFAAGFYRGLGQNPTDIQRAFRLGCEEIRVRALPDALVPRLRTKSGEAGAFPVAPESQDAKRHAWDILPADLRAQEYANGTSCSVWFGTNRRPAAGAGGQYFSGERDSRLHYGACTVAIPKSHKIGEDRPPWWRALLGDNTPETRLTETRSLETNSFTDGFSAELDNVGADAALVFIHGFNVSFESAAIRAAQLKADLKLPVVAFFSWPSFAAVDHYLYDSDSIQYSREALRNFLLEVRRLAGAKPVHILAHSMGNRGLLWSLRDLAATSEPGLFAQVMLAAPDVDRDNFVNDAHGTPALARRMTIYVSDRDRTLKLSKALYQNDRAGLTPPVTVLDGADTVSVTEVDLSFLGHGYYAAARPVLHDMHDLMEHNSPPERRMGLTPARSAGGGKYWRIGG